MSAILAEVLRGGAVESIHFGVIAVVDRSGRLVASVGDPSQFAYFRSSAKPLQAIPVVECGAADAFGITPAELALCCASHLATARHQAQVAAMLSKIGLEPSALQCGIPLPGDFAEAARIATGLVPPSPLQCDCSGKHAGMLAACIQRGFPIDTYLDPTHPLQREILELIAAATHTPKDKIRLATDGCSLPTFGLSVQGFATAYATIASPESVLPRHVDAIHRLRSAMTAHPENVAGATALVTDLMELSGGDIVAKSGAEGLLCIAVPKHEIGIAIRVLDGSHRAHAAVACRCLRELQVVSDSVVEALLARHDLRVLNHNRLHVGDIVADFTFSA